MHNSTKCCLVAQGAPSDLGLLGFFWQQRIASIILCSEYQAWRIAALNEKSYHRVFLKRQVTWGPLCRDWNPIPVKVQVKCKSLSHVQLFETPWNIRILQARILEWVAFPFSRRSSQPRDQTQVSRIAGGFFTSWATRVQPLLFIFPGWKLVQKHCFRAGSK